MGVLPVTKTQLREILKNDLVVSALFFLSGFFISFYIVNKIGFWARDTALFLGHRPIQHELEHLETINSLWVRLIPSVSLLRMIQALFLALGIFASYFLFKFITDRETAILSSLLLVTTPFFITAATEIYPVLSFLFVVSVLSFFKYVDSGIEIYAYATAFVVGVGITQRVNFAFAVVSLFASSLIMHFFGEVDIFKGKFMKVLSVSLVLLVLGTMPVLISFVRSESPFEDLSQSVTTREETSVGDLADEFTKTFFTADRRIWYGYEFGYREFDYLYKRDYGPELRNDRTWLAASRVSLILFIASLIGFAVIWFKERLNVWEKIVALTVLIYPLLFLVNPGGMHEVYYHQIYMIIPLITIVGLKKMNSRVLVICLVVLLTVNGVRIYQFNELLSDRERLEVEAPAFTHLEGRALNYIEEPENSKVITMEWERSHGFRLLTNDKLDLLALEEVGRFQNSSSIILDLMKSEIRENTYLVMPVENWKESEAEKIIYYCFAEKEDNWCDAALRALEKYIKEENPKYEIVGNIESLGGIEVYDIYRIKE